MLLHLQNMCQCKDQNEFLKFHNRFNDFLELFALNDSIYVFSNFYIHFEKHYDPSTQKFTDLLDELSLQQPIAFPTHKEGHSLDLLLMRDSHFDSPAPSVLDMALSDHISSNSIYHITALNQRQKLNIKSIDIHVFKFNLAHNRSGCDASSFYDFTICIEETLHKFAPLKKRIVSSRHFAPWINIVAKALKQVKRQAE